MARVGRGSAITWTANAAGIQVGGQVKIANKGHNMPIRLGAFEKPKRLKKEEEAK